MLVAQTMSENEGKHRSEGKNNQGDENIDPPFSIIKADCSHSKEEQDASHKEARNQHRVLEAVVHVVCEAALYRSR